MPEEITRVLVVDDSAFMRKVISDILRADNTIEVVDTAKNGAEALEKVKVLKPDVVTLDVEMPVMDGLTCLKKLLDTSYTPVIMLSSLTKDGEEATIQALGYGAVDFITKPTNIFGMSDQAKKRELIEKVKVAKNAAKPKKYVFEKPKIRPKSQIAKSESLKYIVAIGTSTGGPKALQDVIPLIPGDVPAAFLVVQHMPPGFTKSLGDRLNSLSEVVVKEAEDGENVKPGYVYIAPGNYHLLVERHKGTNLKLKLNQGPSVGGHRPSVDVMMNSLSDTGLKNIIGVIMTGMGGDGSEGIVKIKRINNGHIIAQDEKSCVVYGMPRAAVQTGVVDAVVPLKEIAGEIMKFMGVHL
ncbi:MAG: chemotaxis response regulator protein-glutamate methylesterase [Clostridiales bacterium]|nr:chemotaxis response regulator protein-glutamate methylesterase [Eubacteriales bacterium]MDH7565021.1 chemotaxis response regulator protein-glutamate methylesterase [Clostridiales bacterium]